MESLSRRRALLVFGATLLLPLRSVHGHHGWGNYDPDNPMELSGIIETMAYDWPHAEMHLAAEDRLWEVVLGPPSRTRGRGLTEEVAVPGVEATVMGYPHRSRAGEIRVEWVAVSGERFMMR